MKAPTFSCESTPLETMLNHRPAAPQIWVEPWEYGDDHPFRFATGLVCGSIGTALLFVGAVYLWFPLP